MEIKRIIVFLFIMGALLVMTTGCLLFNSPPTAVFTADTTSGTLTVDFDASGSYDPDGDQLTYHWDFGDGDTDTGRRPSHIYDTPGEYGVILKARDIHGATGSHTEQIQVTAPGNTPPDASFTADPTSGRAPLTVNFDATGSNDPDGDELTYHWDFGDGETDTGETTSHIYSSSGTYTVELTVTDADQGRDSVSKVIEVTCGCC
jgi:cellulose 1,4-beta-cellobiosidase